MRNSKAIIAALHRAEEYFFTAISHQHQHFIDKEKDEGIKASAYITGIEMGGFNVLYVKEGSERLESFVKSGIQLLKNSALPYSVMVRDTLIHSIQEQLDAQEELAPIYSTTAMYLDMALFTPQKQEKNDRVQGTANIRRTDTNLTDWAWPLKSAFATDAEMVRQYQKQHQAVLTAKKQLLHFSLYRDNTPVCFLTLSLHNGIARLDDIGTMVKEQGKGHARTLIAHALVYAKNRGISYCFLEASAEGESLYKRMGFVPLFAYTSFELIQISHL